MKKYSQERFICYYIIGLENIHRLGKEVQWICYDFLPYCSGTAIPRELITLFLKKWTRSFCSEIIPTTIIQYLQRFLFEKLWDVLPQLHLAQTVATDCPREIFTRSCNKRRKKNFYFNFDFAQCHRLFNYELSSFVFLSVTVKFVLIKNLFTY